MIKSTYNLDEEQKAYMEHLFIEMKKDGLVDGSSLDFILNEWGLNSFLFYYDEVGLIHGGCFLQFFNTTEIYVRLIFVDVEFRGRGIFKKFVKYIWDNFDKVIPKNTNLNPEFLCFGVMGHNKSMMKLLASQDHYFEKASYFCLGKNNESMAKIIRSMPI